MESTLKYYRMRNYSLFSALVIAAALLTAFSYRKVTTVYLIGDSTVADYTLEDNYESRRYPIAGWGQLFQPFFVSDSLRHVRHLLGRANEVVVDNRAKGGRSTRTFFQEGRWAAVYRDLRKGDVVMIQFGHNDAAENKDERDVDALTYEAFFRLFIVQDRQKGALTIKHSTGACNNPWQIG